ncbi:MAG: tRNA pseudouridine(13) synthase TruD [Planctomycetaceae bacterium]
MKLRRLPEDFQVDELTRVIAGGGPFAFYRLTKKSIGTPEAISAISDRWRIQRKRISFGGLKDRHAVTSQHLTIHNGPRKSLQQTSFNLEYLGQTTSSFTPADFHANRFQLVLRDMQDTEIRQAAAAIEQVRLTGLPNYFDDQRFGSLGESGDWMARAWCRSDWERALWLAIADPHRNDSASEKQQKQQLREFWGQWSECQKRLDHSPRRRIVDHLANSVKAGRHPDFRGALTRICVDLRGLYLSAYQSALWNRWLTRVIENQTGTVTVAPFDLLSGRGVFPLTVSPEAAAALRDTELQLPCARIDRPAGLPGELLDIVLREEDIQLRELRVKYPRDSFFSKGLRRAIVNPESLSSMVHADELHEHSWKLLLSFELPRGSYATILVKRLTEVL